jgi:hypothetical protein
MSGLAFEIGAGVRHTAIEKLEVEAVRAVVGGGYCRPRAGESATTIGASGPFGRADCAACRQPRRAWFSKANSRDDIAGQSTSPRRQASAVP